MFGSQLTSCGDADFAEHVFTVARDIWGTAEERFEVLKQFDAHIFLLVDGRLYGGELVLDAPRKMRVTRRGRWIFVKCGIGYDEWSPLSDDGRIELGNTRIAAMMKAVCDRAADKMSVDRIQLDAFYCCFVKELRARTMGNIVII